MNIVAISGRLTRDPELRYTQSGKAVASFSVAVNEGKDRVTYVDCTAWEKTAELVSEHFTKGKAIEIQGRLQNESWETEGQKRSKTSVVVTNFGFSAGGSGSKDGSENATENNGSPKSSPKAKVKPKTQKQSTPQPRVDEDVEVDDNEDSEDLPF